MTRTFLATSALTLLAILTGSTAAQDAPEEKTITLTERLGIHQLTPHLLLGKLADGHYEALAKELGVKRVIVLAAPANADLLAPVIAAGMKAECHSLVKNINDPPDQQRVDFQTVRELVDTLRSSTEDIVYVCGDDQHDYVNFLEFTYRLIANNEPVADALRAIVENGFAGHRSPGMVRDMKLLASGLQELPNVSSPPISNTDLLGKGELIQAGGAKLHVKQLGKGDPVYVLHGGPGETHRLYRPFFDVFAQKHKVVYYDQRGCGYSSKPQYAEAYTLEMLAKELDSLRQALGHDRISLIAHSTGGLIAVRYALDYPEHLEKMVIVSSWASGEQFMAYEKLIGALMPIEDVSIVVGIQKEATNKGRHLNDQELSLFAQAAAPQGFFGVLSGKARADWNRRILVGSFANTVMSDEVFKTVDLRPKLEKVLGIPTLVIAGEYDFITPPSVVRLLADGIKGAEFHVLPLCGHFSFVEQNEAFTTLVEEFLATPAPK